MNVKVEGNPTDTVLLVIPQDETAREWIEENVQVPDYMRAQGGIAVEHRYVNDLLKGFMEDGGGVFW